MILPNKQKSPAVGKGQLLHETVTYKIDGTFYEISTSCGGADLLYDKTERLIKAESGKAPPDKGKEVLYNEYSNPFVGREIPYIAINAGVDSDKGDNEFTPFRNLFNDFYARNETWFISSGLRK